MTVEIINLGLPKSGTTTLKHALTQAGFSVADHRIKSREVHDALKRRCLYH